MMINETNMIKPEKGEKSQSKRKFKSLETFVNNYLELPESKFTEFSKDYNIKDWEEIMKLRSQKLKAIQQARLDMRKKKEMLSISIKKFYEQNIDLITAFPKMKVTVRSRIDDRRYNMIIGVKQY